MELEFGKFYWIEITTKCGTKICTVGRWEKVRWNIIATEEMNGKSAKAVTALAEVEISLEKALDESQKHPNFVQENYQEKAKEELIARIAAAVRQVLDTAEIERSCPVCGGCPICGMKGSHAH